MHKGLISDIFSRDSSIYDRIASLIVVFLMVLFVVLSSLFLYYSANKIYTSEQKTEKTIIVDSRISPEPVFGLLHKLTCIINGEKVDLYVTEKNFKNIKLNDSVAVTYVIGQLTGSIIPVKIKKIEGQKK